ncbi:uncharacterized protein Tco025E_00429 [Trypanosoma conorhini]|uniref:FAD-binding domain-containing protein n=1 Tax=Trypanosoma conorhini TaxID=83891 RepID=A0A3R7LHH6_9TRYP|nr:uncharacterized protein Tco025E_00429 [Trypanosoma conorhini]RNF27359.1 hypothetical protein Tco025E_00429 [Trypanosoma conorhini]
MYAVKPWGKVLLIGSGVGAYAMGIGMRWRESNVLLIEKRVDPSYELSLRRRCVCTAQTVKLLTDLGCTTTRIEGILQRAKGWRFLRPNLEVIKESAVFPGCADGEAVYHCQEGSLLRMLRTEFLRFGGGISWGTEAFDAFESGDGSGAWSLRKMYGLETEAEAIITSAKGSSLAAALMVEDPNRMAVLFDEESGVFHPKRELIEKVFGLNDVVIVLGLGVVIHMWHTNSNLIAWRAIRRGQKGSSGFCTDGLHPLIREVLEGSAERHSRVRLLPATTPAIKDSVMHVKMSVLGEGLLPVDPFEWRGDRARCLIEEASALCRAFYGKKYHRGSVAYLLRGIEQDSLSKRASLLRRDLEDAERFMAVHPVIEEEPGAAPIQRVSS